MEKYKPLLIVTFAFLAAAWSFNYYDEYQTVQAENRIQIEKEKKLQELKKQKIEVQALHILVKNKQKAEELRYRILTGEEFEKLAKKFSRCPSGQKGGGLGYVRKGQMVPEFEEAVFNLEENKISEPVKTSFGWHLIKVTDIIYRGDK